MASDADARCRYQLIPAHTRALKGRRAEQALVTYNRGMESDPPPAEVVSNDGVTYRIRRLTEVSQILPLLEKDRVFCALALCYLEPERFPQTRWFRAEGGSEEALVMRGTGSLRGPLLGFGADLFW